MKKTEDVNLTNPDHGHKNTWAMNNTPGCLGYIGDGKLGIIMNHYKDPY